MIPKKEVKKNTPKQLKAAIATVFIILAVQLIYITLSPVIYGENMKKFAEKRSSYSTNLYAKRGTIFDAEGNTLALNISSYTVIAYLSDTRTGSNKLPLHVVDKDKTAKSLAPILNMSEEYILNLLNKNVYQVELGPGGRGITELVKNQIEALNLPGISFIESYKRYYPNGNFASYVLGYAKKYIDDNGEEIVGELGIESKYNNLLKGTDGHLTYQRDRYGYKIPNTKENRIDAVDGSDIYLTINSNIQRFLESAIQNMEKYKPEWANLTLMNAKTGDILATSSIPSFDPNVKDISNYQSPLVTYTFEPGSTMKTFSYLCAIDSGKYDGNLSVKSGSLKIGDDEVRDWNRTGWGQITLDQGFLYSSNVAASTLTQKIISKNELKECYDKYGFGKTTGIELNKEAAGKINFKYPIEVATSAFGQGITTTVMQQLQGLSIIANDGKMVKPNIVEKIVDTNTGDLLYNNKVEKSEQLVKKSSTDYVKNLLDLAVNSSDSNRTGQQYTMPGYDLIGKTGTAQISGTNGKYLTGWNDYIHSFAGMYPKNNPEIIIYAAIKKPNNGANTGIVEAVREIVVNTTKYLNIFNEIDNNSNVVKKELDSYINKDINKVQTELTSNGLNVIRIGNGNKIVEQYPNKGTTVLSKDLVFLVTNGTNYVIPSFIGWSNKDVHTFSKLTNLKYTINGTGFVVDQNITPGTTINNNITVNLNLKDK